MDIIEIFMERHRALRRELESLALPLDRPHGVGWDDRVVLDKERLMRDISAFIAAFDAHKAAEDELLSEVSDLASLDAKASAGFAEGRRCLGEIIKLFSVVAFSCDGEHVYRVRELLLRLRQELESHLAYNEKILFPALRERLPAGLLIDLGRRALAGGRAKR